jgi:urease accessory protein
MFATPSPSERALTVAAMQRNRAMARLALSAKRDGDRTRLDNLREGGGYRIKFPTSDGALDAVIVNTGGGLLGGDRLSLDVHAGAGANVRMTTQSAEKIYRAFAAPATIDVALRVESGAALHWTPQESILFSGARLTRRIEADLAGDAELVIAEAAVFGRLEMGERLGEGLLAESWRIRRGGRLVHAEEMRLDGDLSALLDRPALGGGARAAATLLLFAPDAEARLDVARALIGRDGVSAGASAWDGRLVVRVLGLDPAPLRQTFVSLAAFLTGRDTPRFW